MSSHLASAYLADFQMQGRRNLLKLYVSGRCRNGLSRLGEIILRLDSKNRAMTVESISENPVVELGARGSFDHRGMSYPYLVSHSNEKYIFYCGWKLTVDTKFENNLGLIKFDKTTKSWIRVSEGPVLPIDSVDPFGIGSTTVAFNPQDNLYYMLYTSFLEWKSRSEHRYTVKMARSRNMINWEKSGRCLIANTPQFHSICRANFHNGKITLCARGRHYELFQIKVSQKLNELFYQTISFEKFQKITVPVEHYQFQEGQCYPHVTNINGTNFISFNDIGYGKAGICILGKSKSDW